MKWTNITVDLSKIRKTVQHIVRAGRTFSSLIVCTLFFFIVIGMGSYIKDRSGITPSPSMKALASSVPTNVFAAMIGMEVPHGASDKTLITFSQQNIFSALFRLVTGFQLSDPKTWLASEMTGLSSRELSHLSRGNSTNVSDSPKESTTTSSQGANPTIVNPSSTTNGKSNATAPASPVSTEASAPLIKPTTAGRKVVMIYHTHNRESFLPELGKKNPDDAYDDVKNITLVGKRLQQKLEQQGVGTILFDTDYKTTEKNFYYPYSYKYSGKTVTEAIATYPDVKFIFDIHRDSDIRPKTTATINGVSYAQVFFIIGKKNPNWEQNAQFATLVQQGLDERKPGLAKGILGKTANDGNAEYNQSLASDSVLIEIGGPYNTLEECYRTVDVLAEVIRDLYWNATKVNAPAPSGKPAVKG